MSAWVLPDHIADVLPSEARHIEELRRELLDTARGYGYELVMPPLLEHLESLLTGTGEALDLQTFKLVDQLSGRMLGLRADTTPQVARIDAHLLNRRGVTRLCYCGPVLHTRPDRPHATREPLQFGAEIYGHAGLEADLEALLLALDCLQGAPRSNRSRWTWPMPASSARCWWAGTRRGAPGPHPCRAGHQGRDRARRPDAELPARVPQRPAGADLPLRRRQGAGRSAQGAARHAPPIRRGPEAPEANGCPATWTGAAIRFDLADLRGYAYYSGVRFGIYTPGASDALVRGGRYDEVGAVFGRNRPAVGFSLDVKELVGVAEKRPLKAAIRAPWLDSGADAADLRAAIAKLRGRRNRGLRAAGPRKRSGRVPLRPRAGPRRSRPLGRARPLIRFFTFSKSDLS
jgi:ATP phosphoribosyltransferase regulatory subunit